MSSMNDSKKFGNPRLKSRRFFNTPTQAVILAACMTWLLCAAARAQSPISTDWRDYAILSGGNVTLNSYSTVMGNIYAGGDLSLAFGYGIQRPSQNLGNMYTRGSFTENSLSQVTGNVFANVNANFLGSANLAGNVVYGGTVSYPSRSAISGTVMLSPNSVPVVPLPSATTFTPGTQNITASSDLTLQPGSYGDVTFSGLYDNFAFTSGDYYLKSLNITSSSNLHFNFTNGPIRIFVQGDIHTSGYIKPFINGTQLADSNSAIQRSLASEVLFESHGNVNIEYEAWGFFGTIFAPNGTVNMQEDMESMYGSILAGGAVNANVYLVHEAWNASSAPFAMLSAANATVIAGGTANLGANVTNLARAGMGNLGYTIDATVKSGSVTLGSLSPTPGLLAEGASQNHTVTATSSNIGLNTVSFTANTDGFNPTETATATLTVLDHAAPTLSSSSANVRVMKGASATASTSLQNTSATYRAGLQIVNLGGMTGAAVGDVIAKGSSKTLSASVSSSTTGLISTPFTVKVSDDRSISGATDRPDQTFTVNASVLDDRRVTAPGNTDIGYIHLGGTISGNVALSTTGDDNHFTRITVANSSAADSNGIALSGGTTSFRFGFDGMTTTRSLGGTPKALGTVQGTLSLTTGAESGITGTQTLANVPVGYTVHVYSGKASWNAAAGGSWGDHTKWQDNLSVSGGSPGIANFDGDSATLGNVIGSNTSEITLNGNSPKLALLSFNNNQGGSYTISSASNETLTITGAAGTPTIGVNNGNHRIASPIVLTGSSTISVVNSVDSLALNGNVSVPGGLTKTGNGTLALTGANIFGGTVVISEGAARGPVRSLGNAIVNNSTLICDQDVDVNFSGSMTGTGAFTKMGAAKVTLAGADNFKTTGPIAVAQGALATPYGIPYEGAGISIANGANYIAGGTVKRAISGFGSVAASDDLTIGKSASTGQFNQGGAPGQGGTLIVGQNAVVILSKDRAILGTLTNLDAGGSLTTINGSQLGNAASLDVSKMLRAAGNATINGDFINNGLVCGPSASGEWLTFTQDVKGAGNTTGNICYAGSYSPGNSPACITSENLLLDPTNSLIMEIGGSTPGVQYDQLRVSQLAVLDGTLSINTIDGYALDPNKSYDLIAGPITGQFDQVMGLPAGWSLNYLPNGVSIAVPEPSSGMLISLAIGFLTLAFGKTKRTAATAI